MGDDSAWVGYNNAPLVFALPMRLNLFPIDMVWRGVFVVEAGLVFTQGVAFPAMTINAALSTSGRIS